MLNGTTDRVGKGVEDEELVTAGGRHGFEEDFRL
jgi:hypothetical protein